MPCSAPHCTHYIRKHFARFLGHTVIMKPSSRPKQTPCSLSTITTISQSASPYSTSLTLPHLPQTIYLCHLSWNRNKTRSRSRRGSRSRSRRNRRRSPSKQIRRLPTPRPCILLHLPPPISTSGTHPSPHLFSNIPSPLPPSPRHIAPSRAQGNRKRRALPKRDFRITRTRADRDTASCRDERAGVYGGREREDGRGGRGGVAPAEGVRGPRRGIVR